PFHHPERRIELYSPPYLFAGPRPRITGAPATTLPGGDHVVIATPDAGSVDAVALLRYGSATHSLNTDQRHIRLAIVGRDAGSVTVAPPPDGYVAPPGPYLLFLLRDGVPSVAAEVRVEIAGAHGRRHPVLGTPRSHQPPDVFV